MAAEDPAKIFRQPGRLVKDPTSLSGSFPYGGTALGYTRDGFRLHAVPGEMAVLRARDRKRGFDYLYTGDGEIALKVDFIQVDDDVLGLAYPGGLTAAGSSTGAKIVTLPGTLKPGAFGSEFASKFLFVPDNTRRGKWILFRKAMPWLEETAEQHARRRHPLSYPLVFKALVDTAATEAEGLIVVGDKRDISL